MTPLDESKNRPPHSNVNSSNILTATLMERNIESTLRESNTESVIPTSASLIVPDVNTAVNPEMLVFSVPVEIVTMMFNCSETKVITSSSDRVIRVWDFSSGKIVNTLLGHKSGIVILDTHPFDDYILLSGCLEGCVFVWNINSGQKLFCK